MSDQQQQDGAPEQERENLSELRSAADEGRKAKRELAFVKAGIDTDTPLGAMFATAYSGDLTKDAIAEEWEKIAPSPQAAVEQVDAIQADQLVVAQEQDVQRAQQDRARRSIASTPAEPVAEPTVDPLREGYKQFHENLSNGVTRDRAAKPVFEAIIGGAANGDQRFIWNGEWSEEEMSEGRTSRL